MDGSLNVDEDRLTRLVGERATRTDEVATLPPFVLSPMDVLTEIHTIKICFMNKKNIFYSILYALSPLT